MVARAITMAFEGVDPKRVDVQVQLAPGIAAFIIVGLPDKAVAESRERVRAALMAIGLSLPPKRIIVNLAPADLPKEGSHYDLPIALAIMAALGVVPKEELAKYVVLGELSLDATIAPVAGILPAAIGANSLGLGLICPQLCGSEAAWASEDLDLIAPMSLLQIVNHFQGHQVLSRPEPKQYFDQADIGDLSDIRGQELAKRALEIAAAGGHNMVMVGPPGSGKTMLASRLPGILPPLSPSELLDVAMVQSIAGQIEAGELSKNRPFRAPHHSASMAAMVGGGIKAKPGEVSLAHKGVLFLDELPEFSPQVLDSLRQPLEDGITVIARANHRVSYPSDVQLIAAMNPCRCGKAGIPGHHCKRGQRCVDDYMARLSGPFMDRIDLHVTVGQVMATDLVGKKPPSEKSEDIRKRVIDARDRQQMRYKALGLPEGHSNASAPFSIIQENIDIEAEAEQLLQEAAQRFSLSARAYSRILRIALTLFDLSFQKGQQAEKPTLLKSHLAEAIGYRVQIGSL